MRKKEKGLIDTNNSVVIAGCGEVGHIRGLNGNGKKYNIKRKKKKKDLASDVISLPKWLEKC